MEEENLQKNRFLDLIENTNEIVQCVDRNGKFVYVNKSWIKKLGYSKKEALEINFPKIIRRDHLKRCTEIFQRILDKGSIEEVETVFVSKKGNEVHVRGSIKPRIIGGKFVETQAIFRDISKEKEGSSRYKALYESSKDAIMTLEPPLWRFTSGNPSTVELFECKDEQEFISYTPGDLSPKIQPDGNLSSSKAKKMIMEALKEGSNLFEWTHVTSKGKKFPAKVLLTKFKKDGKDVLQATVRNISREKQLEAHLRKFSIVVEESPVSVMITDSEGVIEYVNSKFEEMTGYSSKEAIGKTPRILKSGKMSQKEYAAMWKEIKSGKEYRAEFYNKRKDGSYFWVMNFVSSLKDSKGRITNFIGIHDDITSKKNSENELIKTSWELERFNQLSVDREIKMIDLKKEINFLLGRLGEKKKYKIVGGEV